MGVGEATQDKKKVEIAATEMQQISGQKGCPHGERTRQHDDARADLGEGVPDDPGVADDQVDRAGQHATASTDHDHQAERPGCSVTCLRLYQPERRVVGGLLRLRAAEPARLVCSRFSIRIRLVRIRSATMPEHHAQERDDQQHRADEQGLQVAAAGVAEPAGRRTGRTASGRAGRRAPRSQPKITYGLYIM